MDTDAQPELFQVPEQGLRPRNTSPLGMLRIRHDHAVLLLIGALIGVSVTFACGVERGKLLARSERLLLAPRTTLTSDIETASDPGMVQRVPPAPAAQPQTQRASVPAIKPAMVDIDSAKPSLSPVAPMAPKALPSTPAKKIVKKSRFAIQIVTYTQPKLAQRELDRLKSRGEAAFLVTKKDRVILCIGPFPSKQHAAEKLASLKRQYQDCFVRDL